MANYGIAPPEEVLLLDGVNDEKIKIQQDAHKWWASLRSKRALRGKHRGLNVTQIYVKLVLKK